MTSSKHPASDPDEEVGWIAGAAAGDEQAIRWLVERYQDHVYSVALRLLRDSEQAAEAAQDAFIKAFRGLDRFESRARFSTWLYRIAVNVCYDRLGRKPRLEVGLDELTGQGFEPLAGPAWSPEGSVEEAEGQAAFEDALASLGETYRVAFVLRQIEGRSYEEIAGALEISEANAKVRVHRAREMMVARLRERGVL